LEIFISNLNNLNTSNLCRNIFLKAGINYIIICNKDGVSLYLYKYIELTILVEILLSIFFFLGGGGLSFSYLSFFDVTYRYIWWICSLTKNSYPHCLTKKLLYPLFQYAIIWFSVISYYEIPVSIKVLLWCIRPIFHSFVIWLELFMVSL